jgi:thioesterase domain-containing protein
MRVARHRIHSRGQSVLEPEIEEVFDIALIPAHRRDLMRTVYNAYRDYVPKPYPGKVTLFRATARALLGSFAADAGWQHYARQVEIRRIVGNHNSILDLHHIGPVAQQMRELLDQLDTLR